MFVGGLGDLAGVDEAAPVESTANHQRRTSSSGRAITQSDTMTSTPSMMDGHYSHRLRLGRGHGRKSRGFRLAESADSRWHLPSKLRQEPLLRGTPGQTRTDTGWV